MSWLVKAYEKTRNAVSDVVQISATGHFRGGTTGHFPSVFH
jgi:hypothetical protein